MCYKWSLYKATPFKFSNSQPPAALRNLGFPTSKALHFLAASIMLLISAEDLTNRYTVARLVAHVDPEQYSNCAAAVLTEAFADSPVLSERTKMFTGWLAVQVSPSPAVCHRNITTTEPTACLMYSHLNEHMFNPTAHSRKQFLSNCFSVPKCGSFFSFKLPPTFIILIQSFLICLRHDDGIKSVPMQAQQSTGTLCHGRALMRRVAQQAFGTDVTPPRHGPAFKINVAGPGDFQHNIALGGEARWKGW